LLHDWRLIIGVRRLMKAFGFDVEENQDSPHYSCVGRPQLRVPSASYIGHVFDSSNSIDTHSVPLSKPHVMAASRTGHRKPNFTLRKNKGKAAPAHGLMFYVAEGKCIATLLVTPDT
jgi:hypothetical protein